MGETPRTNPSQAKKKRVTRPILSAVLPDGTLVEALYRADEAKTLLCVAASGAWRYEQALRHAGVRLVPYSPNNNLLQHQVVLLPSEPEEYESEQALVALIRSFIHRYVDVVHPSLR